jgi:hypothetical protein
MVLELRPPIGTADGAASPESGVRPTGGSKLENELPARTTMD